MSGRQQDVLDRLIEEGLALYGQGDLDGALVLWERVLADDPGNAQATSYVDYVRTNYDTLTAEGQEAIADPGPFALANDAEPDYVIEVSDGERPPAATPIALASDNVDAGWDDEAGEGDRDDDADGDGDTIDLRTAQAQLEETFDDATREYDPSMRTAPTAVPQDFGGDTQSFSEKTGIRKRDLGFVTPTAAPPAPPAPAADPDFEPPTREHRAGGARDILSFELDDAPLTPVAQSTAPTRELGLATAPTRDLPGTFDALISAPTRELGLRQLATQPTELAETVEPPRGPTRADIVLPFDPVEARAAQILQAVDAGAPAGEPKDDQTRRRISLLLERAAAWSADGDLDRAVAAVELALAEDPNSALAQKLIQRNRDTIMQVFQAFLGDLARQPMLARPLHELSNAPISPRAAFLLSRVDGTLTIDEILDVSGMPRMEAYRYLCQLYLRGILR
jgi:tetratricopeptide (TPR) repeat protein